MTFFLTYYPPQALCGILFVGSGVHYLEMAFKHWAADMKAAKDDITVDKKIGSKIEVVSRLLDRGRSISDLKTHCCGIYDQFVLDLFTISFLMNICGWFCSTNILFTLNFEEMLSYTFNISLVWTLMVNNLLSKIRSILESSLMFCRPYRQP